MAAMFVRRALLVVLAVVAVLLLSPPATATEYIVGDATGWGVGYNYTEWTKGKEFTVGDTLVFKYDKNKHNVYNVTGTDFQKCNISDGSVRRDSGDDTITLKTPGKKWYICGVKGHCQGGQKLVITVLNPSPPAPAGVPVPAPSSSPSPAPAPAPAQEGPTTSAGGMLAAVPATALAVAAAAFALL